ncbi:MAG: lipocalin-like domain-containing protein [bacterium]
MSDRVSYFYRCFFILIILMIPLLATGRAVNNEHTYSFPKDHYAHPECGKEWWYYTGHLTTEDNKKYGYELTFFRVGVESQRTRQSASAWAMRDIYFAHMAISDEGEKKFHFWEKMNRKGPGIAGAEDDRLYVWNEGWLLEGDNETHHLTAHEDDYGIDLVLIPLKPPVIHDQTGPMGQSPGSTLASYYYSLTRIDTKGHIWIAGKKHKVRGITWMDHQFFTHFFKQWDWFSIQLNNQIEIMFFHFRSENGRIDPASFGTIVDETGNSTDLSLSEFTITPMGTWTSKKSGAVYPSKWSIDIKGHYISLNIMPTFNEQELITQQAIYWEGSCLISGTYKGKKVTGRGYAELTGYAGRTPQ